MIIRKGPEEMERIARAGELVAATIAHVGDHIEPGITTGELDDIAGAFIAARGGTSASKGYHGTYPAEICISPNSMVVHGIPGPYRVAEGDLITIDVGAVLNGAIADSAYTYGVGSIDSEAQRLLDVCQDALAAGIAEARLGNRIGDISLPCRPSSRAPASRSSGASSGTASAATTTRPRTCRTTAGRAGARSSRKA